jgi:hypothetical protein
MIHIYNGEVVAEAARRTNLPGDHFVFRESLATGPATGDLESRAQFLASATRESALRVRNELLDQERALATAMEQDEIVFWFEHDLFCLANLLSLLDRFASHRNLTMVWNPRPLSEAEDLTMLFDSRLAITPAVLETARAAWRAYTSPDPTALNGFLREGHSEFPFLREGLTLHASRFPSIGNGLGVLEHRLLTLIAEGATDFMTLFNRFDVNPPRLGFGDTEVLRVLRLLGSRAVPLLIMSEEGGIPPKALFALTPAAENVLKGEVDYVRVNDPDYWVGAVHLTRDNVWRWHEQQREIVPNPTAG